MRKNRFGANLAWLARDNKRKLVADFIGINTSTLTNYVHSRIDPPMHRALAIAEYFKISLDDLFYADMEDPAPYASEPEAEYGNAVKWINLLPVKKDPDVIRNIMLPGLPYSRETVYITECKFIGMEPKINEGDLLIFTSAPMPENFQVRLVVTSGGVFIGRMKMEDAENFILIHENASVPTTHINLKNVVSMYRIVTVYKQERI